MNERAIYDEIARIHRDGGAAALATVIGTLGSTPGKTTMKLLVRRDGTFCGSVGGGCVEAEVLERGLEVMRSERSQRLAVDLNEHDNPETGLICGGRVEIFIEPIVVPNVFLFGAGHVARAICAAGAPAGFRFVVVDDREDFATAERFPAAAACRAGAWRDAIPALAIDEHAFLLVLTRGHKDDLEVLRALLAARIVPRYLGMIGSRSKWLTLTRQLAAEGAAPEWLERIKTPIGLPIGARTAEEIAISVLAELVQLRRGSGRLDRPEAPA